jgi:hypothetical protein
MAVVKNRIRLAKLSAAVIACTFALLLAGVSLAFVTANGSWPGSTATFRFNANFEDAAAGDPNEQLVTLQNAMNVWNGKSSFVFVDGGTTTLMNQVNDGVNNVHYRSGASSGSALAVTVIWFQGSVFLDTDIRYFDTFGGGGEIVWARNPSGGQYDIEHVGIHEFGHALGLDHSAQNSAIMFASAGSGPQPHTLTLDDMLGLTSQYGHPTVSIGTVTPSSLNAQQTGQVVTITGTGFVAGDTEVWLRRNNQQPQEIEELTNVDVTSSTSLTAEVPALEVTTSNWPVAIRVGGDQTRRKLGLVAFVAPPAPTVLSVNPASGAQVGGDQVTITGTNFTVPSDAQVSFGGVPGTVDQTNGSTEIVATVPAGGVIGVVDVMVTTSGGGGTGSGLFTYSANAPNLVQSGGSTRLGATLRLDLQGSPLRNCALLLDARTGTSVKGGLTLGLACTNKFTIVHNSFSGADATLDALGHREVSIAMPTNPAFTFRSFAAQGVVSEPGMGVVVTGPALTFTIFP